MSLKITTLLKVYENYLTKTNALGIKTNSLSYIKRCSKNLYYEQRCFLQSLAIRYNVDIHTMQGTVYRNRTYKQLLKLLKSKLNRTTKLNLDKSVKDIKCDFLHYPALFRYTTNKAIYKDIQCFKSLLQFKATRLKTLIKHIENNKIVNHIGSSKHTITGRRGGGKASINTVPPDITNILFNHCGYRVIDMRSFEPNIAKAFLSNDKDKKFENVYEEIYLKGKLSDKKITPKQLKTCVISYLYGAGIDKLRQYLILDDVEYIVNYLDKFFCKRKFYLNHITAILGLNTKQRVYDHSYNFGWLKLSRIRLTPLYTKKLV